MIGVARREATFLVYGIVLALGLFLGLLLRGLPPLYFLLTLVSLGTLTLFLLRIRLSLSLVVVAVPLIAYRQDLGPLPLDVVTVAVAVVVAAALVDTLREDQWQSQGTPYSLPYLLFLGVGLLSLIAAVDLVEGIAVWLRFLGYFLLSFAVMRALKEKEHFQWIVALMVLAAAVSTLVGLYEYVLRPENSIGLAGLAPEIQGRIAGTYLNPNFFGEYLVLVIPLGLAVALAPNSSFVRRVGVGLVTVLLLIALALTFTRGSWLSLGVGLLLFGLLTEGWLVALLAGVFGTAIVMIPGLVGRFMSIFSFTGGTVGFRFKLWQIPIGMLRENPLFGVGIGNYLSAFTNYVFSHPELSVGWVVYGAHSIYLTIGAEMGLAGLLVFALIIISIFRTGLYLHKRFSSPSATYWRYLNAGILAALAAFLVNGLTSNTLLHPRAAVLFWFLVGMQGALLKKGIDSGESVKSMLTGNRVLQGSGIVGLARAVAAGWRRSWENHWLGRAGARFGRLVAESRLIVWFKSVPYSPALLNSSFSMRLSSSVMAGARRWVRGSTLIAAIKAQPVVGVVLLAGTFVGYLFRYSG